MKTVKEIIAQTIIYLEKQNIRVSTTDDSRPWGGFLVINEDDTKIFGSLYFPELETASFTQKLSPKILIVAPGQKLSWQYHHRRKEVWKLINGHAAIVRSLDNTETPQKNMNVGELISLEQGERHRLVGLQDWGIIAEMWVHTDANNPSDEEDIVRIQDDFGRK
jgi:mannose-6-phosphate isomerase-like protein (cupin superfamily)